MRLLQWLLLAGMASAASFSAGPGTPDDAQTLTPERRSAEEQSVRRFAATVAADVSREGPGAWRKHFSDSPAFFMAVNGHLEFADSAAATKGIEQVAQVLPHIELRWGDDLRVDVLTPEFAMVASAYHEILTDREGHEVQADGFFTGLVERRGGRWQFRNAHWSAPVPPPKAS